MSRRRYAFSRVEVELKEQRRARWKMRGEPPSSGIEHIYTVIDGNYPQRNVWEFVVRVPKAPDGSVEVRPTLVPNVSVWAGADRLAMIFERATIGPYRGKRYCKIALADPTGQQTRFITRIDEKDRLPYWFRPLRGRMRSKQTIRRTRGTDARALVILVSPDEHEPMIQLFLACKAWVLRERFLLRAAA